MEKEGIVNTTPEYLYAESRRWVCQHLHGVFPRPMKNFDEAKKKPTWALYERAAKLINNSAGHIDPSLYIQALVKFSDGAFDPNVLGTMKAIKIYKNFIENRNCERTDVQAIDDGIKKSLIHICRLMIEFDLQHINQYFELDTVLIPRLAKDLSSGILTSHFLSIVPNIDHVIELYPQDIKNEYFMKFLEEFEGLRLKMLMYEKFRNIYDNFDELINKMIEKLKLNKG